MKLQTIEFVGGPLDGHQEHFDRSPEELSGTAAVPVTADVLRSVSGQPVRGDAAVSSVAIYVLHEDNHGLRYRYLRSLTEQEFETKET